MRAGELLRSRPQRTWAAILRSLALLAIGLGFVLEPEFSLELVAVVGGAWVLYVGIGELLAVVAPPVEAAEGPREASSGRDASRRWGRRRRS